MYIKYYLSSTSEDKRNLVNMLCNTDSIKVVSNGVKKGLLRIMASTSWYLKPDDAYKLAISPPMY